MTENHLLLYRLAELMLQHEQHILPVDLLFDDGQIGDLVKSIQIDSPYQQMLLEGVLTENVRDEKLYVTFTVEGYFHYVLGEVIYKQIEQNGLDVLNQIIEEKNLNGKLEGVELSLINCMQSNLRNKVFELKRKNGIELDLLIKPIASTLLFSEKQNNFELLFDLEKDQDIDLIENILIYLENKQQQLAIRPLHNFIVKHLETNTHKKAALYILAIENENPKTIKSHLKKIRAPKKTEINNYSGFLFFARLGNLQLEISNFNQAIDSYQNAIKILENEKINIDQIPVIKSNIGVVYSKTGDYQNAIKYFNSALEDYLKSEIPFTSEKATILNNLGAIYKDTKELEKSLLFYNRALELELPFIGAYHQNIASTYNNIGLIYKFTGDFKKSLSYFNHSRRILQMLFGGFHPELGPAFNNLASLYFAEKDYNNAYKNYKQALDIGLMHQTDDQPFIGSVYNNIANTLKAMSKFDEAKEYYEKALIIFNNKFDSTHSSINIIRFNLGTCFMSLQNYEQAIELFLIGFQNYKSESFPYHIGLCYENIGKLSEALNYYIKATELRKESKGIDSPETIQLIVKCKQISKLAQTSQIIPLWISEHLNDL
jgi:tetratricopeptide (TPR) repeat protein